MSAASSKSRNAHLALDGEPCGLDRFADAVADKVIRKLEARGIVDVSGIRSHHRKEGTPWCDKKENDAVESLDRTRIDDSGESLWSTRKAEEIIDTFRRRKKQSR
ncbi:MAG: hypothetical protein ABSB49_11945 [Polyangia bacterium]